MSDSICFPVNIASCFSVTETNEMLPKRLHLENVSKLFASCCDLPPMTDFDEA